MSVRQRLYYGVCIFVFKALNDLIPKGLARRLQVVRAGTGRVTRQADSIAIQFRRTRSAQKSMFYEGVKMYNELPMEIRECVGLVRYRRMLKEFIMGEND